MQLTYPLGQRGPDIGVVLSSPETNMPAINTLSVPRGVADQRLHDLGQLLPLWPHECTDTSIEGRQMRVALLRRALRAERCRGLAGHWTYDLARHYALLRCYKNEVAQLAALDGGRARAANRAAARSAG